MSPAAQAVLREWSPPVTVDALLLFSLLLYLRGWILLQRSSSRRLRWYHLAAFLGGLSALWLSIGSPLSAFDEASLTVHMIQHILLMLIAPPLLLLGAPALPFLHGMPQWLLRKVIAPVFRTTAVQSLWKFLSHPVICWFISAAALIMWHVPAAFEHALRSDALHDIEHVSFLTTSLLFWWPVVQPYPSEARWARWTIPMYLFLGMFPSGALGAFLTFCDRVLYPSYLTRPPLFGLTPLEDQIVAGSLMWVLGIFICAVPAVLIMLKVLSPRTMQATSR